MFALDGGARGEQRGKLGVSGLTPRRSLGLRDREQDKEKKCSDKRSAEDPAG
jgi:hypothetical protein